MTDLQAVFWDSDNTLVDTNALHWAKHVETLRKYEITLTDEHRQRIYHNNGRQNWDWLNAEMGLNVPCDTYLEEIDTWYHTHTPQIVIRSGIIEALELFQKSGIPQIVVSNGRRKSVMMALEAKNLTQYFIHIATKEDTEERKPHPGPYLDALNIASKKLGYALNPNACLAIEDDPKGVASAHAAGLKIIHRKLSENQCAAPYAQHVAFTEVELLHALKSFL